MHQVPVDHICRRIGKQVRGLRELVTVCRELQMQRMPLGNREGAFAAGICEPGDLPDQGTGETPQITRN